MGAATLIGGALGLNRYMHHKYIGVRTLGMVAITAAALVAATLQVDGADGAGRVIQGIITGIGFIGAGVIVREPSDHTVRGLTTAATVWVAAAIGALCGLGAWRLLAISIAFVSILLLDGGRLEKAVRRRLKKPAVKESSPVAPTGSTVGPSPAGPVSPPDI